MFIAFLKYHKFSVLLLLAGIVLYWLFAYDLVREDFIKLISLYAALFAVSFKLIQLKRNNFCFLAGIALLFRLTFIAALPNLSQDFYRFIWDGSLILEGINPYLYTPVEILQKFPSVLEQSRQQLITGMGALSAGNYTSYPPVNQFLFAVSAGLAGKNIIGSVVLMRLLIIAADLGTLYLGKKLLENLKLPVHRIFWYILNPFIIIELTGNLHFEGVMIFFLVWALYLLHKQKWIWSAVLLGVSVSVKLLPLLFLPLFLKYLRKDELRQKPPTISDCLKNINFAKLSGFYVLVLLVLLCSFLPFLSSDMILNFSESIGLWFQKFEFNASFYYVVRWIGFQLKGYNIITTTGKILPLIVILFLAGLALFRKNNSTERLISAMLLGVSVYFFLSTTVHPWYLATPLMLSVFTRYKFVLVWSLMVFLSYSAYRNADFQENLWLVALEYLVVLGVLFWELYSNSPSKNIFRSYNRDFSNPREY